MSIIWLIILLVSITTLLFTNPAAAITAMISGSNQSVTLAMTLVALYGFWLGFLAVLDKLQITDFVAKMLRPLIRFLFGRGISKDTEKYISINMSANILGLGNASTPMGIKAINSLDKGAAYATTEMIMLVVISATSLQLLPSTVIGMRATHGSIDPANFLFPTIIATIISTVLGITLVKVISHFFPAPKLKKAKPPKQSRTSPSHTVSPRRSPSTPSTPHPTLTKHLTNSLTPPHSSPKTNSPHSAQTKSPTNSLTSNTKTNTTTPHSTPTKSPNTTTPQNSKSPTLTPPQPKGGLPK